MSDMDPIPPWEDDDTQGAESVERDPDTDDMFGAPAAPEPAPEPELAPLPEPAPVPVKDAPSAAYQVLARKYRPTTFEDLIGQEAMVRTLTHAFETGRIAHAFMLTGVRGVGKTTTARLLARALNNQAPGIDKPSLALTPNGQHDAAIMAGQHMDVMEMDAASHTGVGDIREILDSVRYGPVEARYKVYVLDEVHMLSNQAFNALLKTLEEPPPHAKFIFATTEIRKVPVTILSRCQRFDLRRVEPEILIEHLGRVAQQEGMAIERDALALISRAAEGSVRDGLSLLDQALVQGGEGEAVKAAILQAGPEFDLRQVGSYAYFSTALEIGWIPRPVHAIYTSEEMRAFREWLPADSNEMRWSLGGSLYSPDIEDYYFNPYELGYGHHVKFDHDFIGRAALEEIATRKNRQRVTLAWNPEDVEAITRTYTEKGEDPALYVVHPLSNYANWQYDAVLDADGRTVGAAVYTGFSWNERSMLSTAVVDADLAEPGTELAVLWGEPDGGAKSRPWIEPHRQMKVRATVIELGAS